MDGYAHRDLGGQVDPSMTGIGGFAPSSDTMDPMTRGMIVHYSGLPIEKLQEISAMMGGSPQGKIIQRVLQQKLSQPTAQPTQNAQPVQQQAHGGVIRRAAGGNAGISLSSATPWWTRSEASGINRGATGYLSGATAGRADAIKTQAPGGSYVLPADVVSGLGEGNSLAGARFLQEAISTGPWGTPVSRGGIGAQLPHPVARQMQAHGGGIKGESELRPVMFSHGEFVVTPEECRRIGGGNLEHGHKVLDMFVEQTRKKQIKALEKLPGPVKNGERE